MSIGTILLIAFLIIFGASMLLALSLPGWLIGLLAIGAGFFMAIGR